MIDSRNPSIEFNAQDRCDRCYARALACASKDNLELWFCGHHMKQHNLALEMEGWTIAIDYVEIERIANDDKVPA